ncbi:MAG: hypothetical protein ACJASM_000906 [Salibacteraceae bacterium]|jgi:hypothetical protein
MKNLAVLVLAVTVLVGVSSCAKRKAEKNLVGNYSRVVTTQEVYTDSTSQLLLGITEINFFDNERGTTGGSFISNFAYETKKTDVSDYDLEVVFSDLNWSEWLPSNLIWDGNEYVNSVVPSTVYLDQVKFYVRTSENGLDFIIEYPSYTDVISFD